MAQPSARAAPAFLASVTTAAEACEAFAAGADVIDCKDPSAGALGRLDLAEIGRIVAAVSALAPVSATIGDTFATPADAVRAAQEVAAQGVAIVKCGFFGTDGDRELIEALGQADLGRAHRFAVLMADEVYDFALIEPLAKAGFIGVMLDTANKTRGSLRQIMDMGRLRTFVAQGRAHKLAVGLAGSLREDDIAPLAALAPDLLGFRGALCADGRTGVLDEARVAQVRSVLNRAVAELEKRSVA